MNRMLFTVFFYKEEKNLNFIILPPSIKPKKELAKPEMIFVVNKHDPRLEATEIFIQDMGRNSNPDIFSQGNYILNEIDVTELNKILLKSELEDNSDVVFQYLVDKSPVKSLNETHKENTMARPFSFPDPKDRTPNSPIFLVSPTQVLGLYNQENKKEEQLYVNDKVKSWYIEYALSHGWQKAEFLEHQCLLEVQFLVKA